MDTTVGLVEPFGYGYAYPDWLDLSSPAAGAQAAVTVDGAWNLRVVAARATLTTDANAANRLLTLDYINARGSTYVRNGAAVVVTASTTAQGFEWNNDRGVAEWAANTPVFAPLARRMLPPGFQVRFTVTNIQAGDQLSGLSLVVEKFPTGPRGYPVGVVRETLELPA